MPLLQHFLADVDNLPKNWNWWKEMQNKSETTQQFMTEELKIAGPVSHRTSK